MRTHARERSVPGSIGLLLFLILAVRLHAFPALLRIREALGLDLGEMSAGFLPCQAP